MKNPEINKVSCDVLIVGGGAASSMAAVEAAKYGIDVILVDKGFLGRSGSNPTSGGWGVAAAFSHVDIKTGEQIKDDNPDIHLADVLKGGEFINNEKIVRVVVDEIRDRIVETENFGVHYCKTPDGKFYYQRRGFGHSYARSCFGGAGWELMESFAKEIFYRRVRVMDNTMVTKVFARDSYLTGAFAIDSQTGNYIIFQCPAIILGAGSATGLYKYSSASYLTTGDAYAAVYDLGLEFGNMEFVEFTLIPAPKGIPISTAGISPFIARGANFYNRDGENFMLKYNRQRGERTTRAKLVQGIYLEMKEGRGPCLMDATHINWDEFLFHEPHVVAKLGGLVNPKKERFPWVPAGHSFLGGVKIDENAQTAINGLFATSESATGMHGANRLGGNALAFCYVLGQRAAKYASVYSMKNKPLQISPYAISEEINRIQFLKNDKGEDPFLIEKMIKELSWKDIGVVRNAKDLKQAMDDFNEIKKLKFKIKNTQELIKSLEVINLALTGTMVAKSALMRTESRGHHMRKDFPDKDDKSWRKTIYLEKGD